MTVALPAHGARATLSRRKRPKTSATVADVARLAGVSAATVSRAFSTPGAVAEDTRKRVLAAAVQLDWWPHVGARMMRSGKSFIVGAVIPTLDYALYAAMVNTFQDVMTRSGHMVIVLSVGFDTTAATDRVRLLIERGAEAILFVGRIAAPELVDFLRRRKVPVVTTYSHVPDGAFPSIGFDNAHAMRQVLTHMQRLGHREFMLLSGPQANNDRQAARIGAFNAVLGELGMDPAGRVMECVYALARGAEALRAIRRERPQTTCVLCSSDILAAGVLAECRRLGIGVPGNLSVTGFDDIDLAAFTDPPLTTVAVPAADMGRIAAESLLRALDGQQAMSPVLLESRLVPRGSTGTPRTEGCM